MGDFHFAARDAGGQLVSGTLAGRDRSAALEELYRRRLVPVDLRPAGRFLSVLRRGPRPRARGDELALFTRQLATMIGAGIPLLEALETLEAQAEHPSFRAVVRTLVEEVRAGRDFSQALETCPRAFSSLFVSMARAGEAAGQLDAILLRLADYLEASAALRRDIRSALTYPAVSLVIVLGIATFLLTGVVPQFEPVFEALEVKLPGLTLFVLGAAQWMKAMLLPLAAGIFGLVLAVALLKKTKWGGYAFDRLLLRLLILGPLFQKVALSRFTRTFATLVQSGVPILSAMNLVADASGNRVIARAVRRARDSVRAGDPIASPLAAFAVFPPMVTKMIAVGEKSGSLDVLLEKVAAFYDREVAAAVKSLTSILEPILIAVMGLFVGTIVLSVFLPIFRLQEQLARPR